MVQPILQKGQYGSDKEWNIVWSDEFNDSKLNTDRWRTESIDLDNNGKKDQAAQHAANTYGLDENGKEADTFALGKRHAGWYNGHYEKTISVENGQLVLGGYVSDEKDPTMHDSHHPYFDKVEGMDIDLRKKIYVPWIDTFALGYRDGAQRPNPVAPNQYWRGGYFEFVINFSEMQTPGFRVSAWLMPAVDPDADPEEALVGKVYDNIATNGLEIDLFEYEPAPGCEQLLLMKTIGGNGPGDHPVDASKFGFDLTKGDHVIGLLWEKDRLVWFLNGVEVNRDESHVPWVASAFYFTREINTGVGGGTAGKPSPDKPYLQWDAGLYGRNIGAYQDKIANDKARIGYLRIWQTPEAKSFNWISPYDLGVDGSSDQTPTPVLPTPAPVVTTPKTEPVVVENAVGMSFDGEYITWPDEGNEKWNVSLGTAYLTTIHEPKYKPLVSGVYSVSGIKGKIIGKRGPGIEVDLNAAVITPPPVVEEPVKEEPIVEEVIEEVIEDQTSEDIIESVVGKVTDSAVDAAEDVIEVIDDAVDTLRDMLDSFKKKK